MKNVIDIVKSVPIMSFQMIKASLIAFRIFIERIRIQKVDLISDWYGLSVHI